MRILVVAMVNSIHTVRWLQQFDDDKDLQIILFPSTFCGIKKELSRWTRLLDPLTRFLPFKRAVAVFFPIGKLNSALHLCLQYFFKNEWRIRWLMHIIRQTKPDIIHSLEFQHAGYLCLEARQRMKDAFPTWIATNWGSDIYLFSQLKAHKEKIESILQQADFYSAECARDYELAQNLGIKATPLPVIPNAGGMRLQKLVQKRSEVVTSKRKLLLVKGYQMVFGRALTVLSAIENIADTLKEKNIKICFFSATDEIHLALELATDKYGLDIEVISINNYLPHDEILNLHAKARCYVGISISDGISTSMLEAMALGAFPIQTCTSCANEWIEDGVSGFIAPLDDPQTLSKLILEAINNDELVDRAAEINWDTISKKASYEDVKIIARSFYDVAYQRSISGKAG